MIRPVEMQMLIPNSQTVSNVQHNENQRPVQQNMLTAEQVAKEVKHNSDSIIQKDTVNIRDYRYDAKEKGNGEYHGDGGKKRDKKQEDKNNDKKSDKEPVRVNFDIKI